MEAKSTYALRSADPGSSKMLTNLCFRIACNKCGVIEVDKWKVRKEEGWETREQFQACAETGWLYTVVTRGVPA